MAVMTIPEQASRLKVNPRRGVVAISVLTWLTITGALAFAQPSSVTLHIDPSHPLRTFDHRRLAGSNIAAWIGPQTYNSPTIRRWVRELGPSSLRLPGGSWSDIFFWNGNGMRTADGRVDPTRMKDGHPDIDYRAYAPSFLWDEKTWAPNANWSGNVDVRALHEFVKAIPGCEPVVTVNAGTGRAVDAAEWVRWANKKQGYHVRYWEIGNELEGSWEAGHFLPGGGELTAEMYVKRFREFARAMKAVDPTIEIGGATGGSDRGGYLETLLREAGDYVDFVSFHTYPCLPEESEEEMVAHTRGLQKAVARIRGWIQKYQPARAKQMEIGITEWNLPADRHASDLFSAMWSSIFLGEMARSGVDFADQWDMFTQTPGRDGMALILDSDPPARKSQYWALWLWNRYVGDTLLSAEMQPARPDLYTLATRGKDALYVMFANTSRKEGVVSSLDLGGFHPAAEGETARLSLREYFWNPLTRKVAWSTEPQVRPLQIGPRPTITVPPYSLLFVRIPEASHPGLTLLARPAREQSPRGQPELRLLLPSEGYSDTPVEGWVEALLPGGNRPWPVALPAAKIEVQGPAQADRKTVSLAEPAGRFFLKPGGDGVVTVTAACGTRTATARVTFRPSVPRPHVFWQFKEGTLGKDKGVESDWPMSIDATARPNQTVARIDLQHAIPDRRHETVLRLSSFPDRDKLKRENIRGVCFDLLVSPDFHCDDPNAHLDIIMQSQANYWMQLASLPLLPGKGAWATHTFPATDPRQLRAMPEAFDIWLLLRASKPVTGTLYVDRVGLLVR